MKRSSIVLGALLVPALAYAQQPDPDQTAQPPQPVQQPAPAPAPTPTVVETQTTQPANPNPVVVVNPNTAPATVPAPTAYDNPETDEYDNWNAPVFATGALVFAGTYGASAIVAGSSNHPGADRLYVPVVGPWLALNDWGHCPVDNPACDTNTTDKVLLVADGVFQAAGLITMLDGVLEPSSHHVYAHRYADKGVHVAPTGNGAMVFGRF
jgi:hypothetical protein